MLPRHILPQIKESFSMFPSILLTGGRQTGKSVILTELKKEGIINEIYTLDRLSTLQALSDDPEGFVERTKLPVAFDEIQRYPNLMLVVKRLIDENKRPGMFILTGSANILSYPKIPDSLSGRCCIEHVEGLSASEYLEKPSAKFIDLIFGAKTITDIQPHFLSDFKLIDEEIFYGAYPEVRLQSSQTFRNNWFDGYETTYIERDVRNLNNTLDIVSFAKVFQLLALQSGNLVNIQHLASEIGLDQRTIKRYLEILTLTFQMTLLHPFSVSGRATLVKSPKVYMNDVGHASYCQRIKMTENINGNLLETWVFGELRKAIALTEPTEIYFYRTAKGREVDFILKQGHDLRAIECKSKTTITTKDLVGLKDFLEYHPSALGIVLYKGDKILPLSSRIIAIPMTCLYS
jgi:predicted AAA+ superfamily ATPase